MTSQPSTRTRETRCGNWVIETWSKADGHWVQTSIISSSRDDRAPVR